MVQNRLKYLYERCVNSTATPEEQQEMDDLLQLPENELLAKELVHRAFSESKEIADIDDEKAKTILESIFIEAEENEGKTVAEETPKFNSYRISKLSAAALLLVLLGAGIYFLFLLKPNQRIATAHSRQQPYENDLLPGTNKALLTLSNGAQIPLDSVRIGAIAQQGDAKIIKLNSGKFYILQFRLHRLGSLFIIHLLHPRVGNTS